LGPTHAADLRRKLLATLGPATSIAPDSLDHGRVKARS
jgi:hypothetical protein